MKRRYAAIGLVILLLLGLAGTAVVALSGADEAAEADVTEADVRPENKPSEQAAEPAPRPEERAKAATAERAEKAKARAKARPAEPAPTPAENADAPPGARIDAGQPVEPDAVAEKPSGQPRPAPAEDETTPPPAEPRHQAARTPTPPPKEYKAAVLHVVTNFEKADVTVNGLKYPEYIEPGEAEGMVLPAGGPYDVLVKFGENTKKYILNLRPHETRLLVVEGGDIVALEGHVEVDQAELRRFPVLGEQRVPLDFRQRRQHADERLPLDDRQPRAGEARDAAHQHDGEQQPGADEEPAGDLAAIALGHGAMMLHCLVLIMLFMMP